MDSVATVVGSVARTAEFEHRPPEVDPRPRRQWRTGDYVVCEVREVEAPDYRVETPSGESRPIDSGDRIIGALGARAATLQAVGDWRAVGDDLEMHALTVAGVLGRCTSIAIGLPPLPRLRYLGHAIRDGVACTMRSTARRVPERPLRAPAVLIIGTSMDAGKTVSAVAIVRELKRMGLRVAGTKLTGVGRYRDILAMRDAGADQIADFVDAGLPSTVVPEQDFERAVVLLKSQLAAAEPDVVVAEAGASPLEPYNGELAVRLLAANVRATVLCASDPYAVVGVMQAFGSRPDLIAGRATSTEAAIALIEKLVDIPALNLLDPASSPQLAAFLRGRIGDIAEPAVSA